LQNEEDDLSQEGAAAGTEGPITTQPTSQENRSYGSIDGGAPHPSAATETGYQVSS